MRHPDRKPGVKLVTDPPKRLPKVHIRLSEADAARIGDIVAAGVEARRRDALPVQFAMDRDAAGRYGKALRAAMEPRNVNY